MPGWLWLLVGLFVGVASVVAVVVLSVSEFVKELFGIKR